MMILRKCRANYEELTSLINSRSLAAAGAGNSNGKSLPVSAPARGQGRRQVPHGTERRSGRRR